MTDNLTNALTDLDTGDLEAMADEFYARMEKAADTGSPYVRLYAALSVAAIDALAAR
ncbi:hypothetical protein AB0M02_13435 [Actinoplanes sp. NPDC051861]|uniref:hypothetical protein n=1 Tax=Actinoplanes sp. NPDC051861 TaxID=3155170 RepID=UPI0034499692